MAKRFISDAEMSAAPRQKRFIPDAEMSAPSAEVLDERSPDISFGDRAIAKNLAQSGEKQIEFLQKEYPHLEVKMMGSDVVMRPKTGGGPFRKLDPSTLELEDISDIGNDVVAGVTSTLGGIGGGMAGALAGGAGALPGALAGTAAAGAGTEALRQRIGQALGIPQEVSAGDAAIEGGLNAAGTLAFGTGKIPGVQNEFKGAIRGAWNTAAPKLAQYWTGVTDDVLGAYVNPTTRERINSLVKGGKTEFTDKLVDRIRGGLQSEKSSVGNQLKESIDNAGSPVNLSGAKKAFEAQISKLEEVFARVPTNENKAALNAAKKTYADNFGNALSTEGALIGDEILPSDAWRLQDQLKDVGDLRKTAGGVAGRHAGNATSDEKAMANTGLEAYRSIGQELDRVTDGASPALKKQYGELKDLESVLDPSLRTDQSAYSTFTNLDGKSKVAFKEALEKLGSKTGENYKEPVTMLQAADYFGSGSWVPKSIGGTTSTSRTVPASVIGGLLGGKIGAGFGMPGMGAVAGVAAGNATASPQMLKKVIENTDWMRYLADQTGKVADAPGVTPAVREIIMRSPWLGME